MPGNSGIRTDLLDRLIPLPKQVRLRGAVTVSPAEVTLVMPEAASPLLSTAAELLRPMAEAPSGARLGIRLSLLQASHGAGLDDLRATLEALPYSDQAYAIRSLQKDAKLTGLLLAACTPLGLLYAARTLSQVAGLPKGGVNPVDIPDVDILDWPDLEERGLWGGNASQDLAWMAERKMNVVEVHAALSFDADHSPKATLDAGMLETAARHGIRIVPIITHLEQMSHYGLFIHYPEVASTPDPKKPLPTDYEPGICFSQQRTVSLLAEWMQQLLGLPGVSDVMVWLSEDAAPCFCPTCAGKQPFVMEVRGITAAFEQARKSRPGAALRILTTQGSFPVNDQVLAAISPDTKLSYYHGGKTYDSSHKPMIGPLLEAHARSGRWLGVYPQLTNSWRTVFPFTGPQLIRARMTEFVDKGLRCLIGYATPSNRYYEFNITAAAEWAWNSRGRSTAEFARAYATRAGLPRPDTFAQWAERVGKAGWDAAGSRIVEGLIFDPKRTLSATQPAGGDSLTDALAQMEFGKGLLAEFSSWEHFQTDLNLAQQSLDTALQTGNLGMVEESRCLLAVIGLLQGLQEFIGALSLSEKERVSPARAALNRMDEAARTVTVFLHRWGMRVNPVPLDSLPSRFRDTVNFASRVAHAAWEIGVRLGIQDPWPAYRMRPVMEWTSEDFARGPQATLEAEVTGILAGPGEYDVTFQFLDGMSGINVDEVALSSGQAKETSRPLSCARSTFRVGRWDRWVEYWLTLPAEAIGRGDRFFLSVKVSGPPAKLPPDRRTSHGRILMRKSWRGGSEALPP
ncbi:MAG: hypothetical protein HYU36_12740 [Planctomycetes bacterium]|nr:hypothetical protein [Planctomycetota bacterium]